MLTMNVSTGFPHSSSYQHQGLILFDLLCIVELAPWRPIRHKMGKLYMEAYHRYFPISSPKDDHNDRNILYCMQVLLVRL